MALKAIWVDALEVGGVPPIQLVPTLQDPLLGFTHVCAWASCAAAATLLAPTRTDSVFLDRINEDRRCISAPD